MPVSKLINLNQVYPSKDLFFWSNLHKIEVMIISLIEMLELLCNHVWKLCIKMQSISVIFNITKVAYFWLKNVDTSRTKGVCHLIFIFWIFFTWGMTVPSFIFVGYVWQILGRRGFFAPPSNRWQYLKRLIRIGLKLGQKKYQ